MLDLVTLAEAKLFCRVDGDTDDAMLVLLSNALSKAQTSLASTRLIPQARQLWTRPVSPPLSRKGAIPDSPRSQTLARAG